MSESSYERPERTIFSSASAGALLTLSKAVVGDARLRLPGPQLVRGVSKDVMKDVMPSAERCAELRQRNLRDCCVGPDYARPRCALWTASRARGRCLLSCPTLLLQRAA